MGKVKYTLDKIEDGQYVFLKHSNEESQLLISENEVTTKISVGNMVLISELDSVYEFEVLIKETEEMRDKVSNLLEKLKNKK